MNRCHKWLAKAVIEQMIIDVSDPDHAGSRKRRTSPSKPLHVVNLHLVPLDLIFLDSTEQLRLFLGLLPMPENLFDPIPWPYSAFQDQAFARVSDRLPSTCHCA